MDHHQQEPNPVGSGECLQPVSGAPPALINDNTAPATQLYDVHVFVVVRIKVENVAAASQIEACPAAVNALGDLCSWFDNTDSEYAEEISGFCVDVVGDAGYDWSKFFNSTDNALLPILQRFQEIMQLRKSTGSACDAELQELAEKVGNELANTA